MKKYTILYLLLSLMLSCQEKQEKIAKISKDINASEYVDIKNIPKSKKYEIIQLVNHPIQNDYMVYDSINKNIITLAATDKDEWFLYKINENGNKDSIHFSYGGDGNIVNGFTILNDNSYIDWIRTSEKQEKKYKYVFDKKENMNQNLWDKTFLKNYNSASEVYYKSLSSSDKFVMHCFLKINNEWYVMYPNKNDNRFDLGKRDIEKMGPIDFPVKIGNQLKLIHANVSYQSQTHFDWEKGNDTIQIKDFIKSKKQDPDHTYLMKGDAFYNFKYKDEELKFRSATDFDTEDLKYDGELIFYYPKNTPFSLIQMTENYYLGSNSDSDSRDIHREGIGLYIIRLKSIK